jgi:hypothetical protein
MRRRRIRRAKQPTAWLWEFSKRVVVVTALLYFVSCIYALIVCTTWQDTATIGTMVSEANETFRVVVGGYMIKAGVENALKIAGNKRKGDTTENSAPEDGGALG